MYVGEPQPRFLGTIPLAVSRMFERMFDARRRARRHTIRLLAAGVAFYGFLALFPALGAAVSIFGLMAQRPVAVKSVGGAPTPVRNGLRQYREQLAQQPRHHLGAGVILGVLVALWSASRGAGALMKALNETYEARETRGYLKAKATALVITVSGVVMLVAAALVATAIPKVLSLLGLDATTAGLVAYLRWPLMLLVVTAALGPVYRFGPCHPQPRPPWLSIGALTAALLWDGGSALLSLYLDALSDLDRTYGSVAATVALLLWLYVAAIAVLFGAEVNAAVRAARQTP